VQVPELSNFPLGHESTQVLPSVFFELGQEATQVVPSLYLPLGQVSQPVPLEHVAQLAKQSLHVPESSYCVVEQLDATTQLVPDCE